MMQVEVSPENASAIIFAMNDAVNPLQAPIVPDAVKLATQAAVKPGAADGGIAEIWLLQKPLHAATENPAS